MTLGVLQQSPSYTVSNLPEGFEYIQDESKILCPYISRSGLRAFGIIDSDGLVSHNGKLTPLSVHEFVVFNLGLPEVMKGVLDPSRPNYVFQMPPFSFPLEEIPKPQPMPLVKCCCLHLSGYDCYYIFCAVVTILSTIGTIAILMNQPCVLI